MFSLSNLVTTSTTDAMGRLKLFSALQMMQDCSEMWFESEPAARAYFEAEGRAQLLAARQVEVIRVPRFGERLTTQTGVYRVEPLFGFRNTFIVDSEGKPCYASWSMGAFVARASGRLARIAPEVLRGIALDEPRPMPYRDRHIALPAVLPVDGRPIAPERNDIDYNGHVNNAQYVRMALELLPADFEVAHFRVEYKRPARLADRLVPHIYADSSRTVVVFSIDGSESTVMEFA